MKPYPCIESTIDLYAYGWLVRVWIDEGEVKESYGNTDLKEDIRLFVSTRPAASMKEIATYVAGKDRVNAVQVKHAATGNGIVLYVNWP